MNINDTRVPEGLRKPDISVIEERQHNWEAFLAEVDELWDDELSNYVFSVYGERFENDRQFLKYLPLMKFRRNTDD